MIEKTYSFIKNGKTYEIYTLANGAGAQMDILTYGARITRLCVPDKNGVLGDVVVGYATPENISAAANTTARPSVATVTVSATRNSL